MPLWNRADDDCPTGDFVVIAISDTDSGMSAEILKRPFEPFYATTAEDTVTKARGFEQCVRQLESSPCSQPPISASHSRTTIGDETAARNRVHSSV
jgi:hypothetical protein